ncbi:MAG: DUF2892 domain-containing protein [Acidobacteriota bacterium]
MNALINFMQGTAGRALRVILGMVLIYAGLFILGGTLGIMVAVIGIVPLAMGIWGPCLLGFVFKQPNHA